ncbi:hypothetical protein WMY93_017558 [Mugilogobius chulae]|uniref:DPF1-3 N-terminal domain-containing protein n=1 Tax=Mugilogobius chulae TaxID=88201 RepID=A0AAW0NP46_9GOBI
MAAVIQNPLKALGDQFYKEAIEQCRSYNARLCAERSVRLPFLDSQTGVAQNNCYIWMERHHRSPGVGSGQMYTYPARCWRKKRRLHNSTDPHLGIYGLHLDAGGLMSKDSLPTQSTHLRLCCEERAWSGGTTLKTMRRVCWRFRGFWRQMQLKMLLTTMKTLKWTLPKGDTEEKEGQGRGSGRRRADYDDDKPYVCDSRYKPRQNSKSTPTVCTKRYRNRTGLSYHYTNSHMAEEERPGERSTVVPRAPSIPQNDRQRRPKSQTGANIPNNYCTKCHGSKKTGKSGSPCTACQRIADCGEEKEDGPFIGAEELFGTTSESDTSTFHGFEDEDLEEPSANSNGISSRHR